MLLVYFREIDFPSSITCSLNHQTNAGDSDAIYLAHDIPGRPPTAEARELSVKAWITATLAGFTLLWSGRTKHVFDM